MRVNARGRRMVGVRRLIDKETFRLRRGFSCARSVESYPRDKNSFDLLSRDDWLNAEVSSDVAPRFLAEFRAWARKR